ncbi:putative glycosyltransferase [Heterostelium album PN500]|uniref:Putative glycosyltransferase n=1 Tax=Heterostelium pallidum (strain ATCC 26659 / Pp 5 / PN500) TaxID=670386 RepID=D3AXV0_HETP5|nr:putative glycosyltransferase [Heterostelium album PN500]EFA85777.1 putative glycosyltransferase [Heterostelium album PN500]|eukprot:XP_020437883.1 putative glycosyltransferase [Heterostelium album PN500]
MRAKSKVNPVILLLLSIHLIFFIVLLGGGVGDDESNVNLKNNTNSKNNINNIKQSNIDQNKNVNVQQQQQTNKDNKDNDNNSNNNKGTDVKINSNGEYAYVTFVNNDEYAKGVVALKQSLDDSGTPYSLVVLVTEKISDATVNRLTKLGCLVELVKPIEVGSEVSVQIARWMPAFTKFKSWAMSKYTRIIWLDSDMLILRSIDHLFSYIDENDSEAIYATVDADANSCAYQPARLKLINSGLVVLAPKPEVGKL